ncbi:MAG: superoxide dismutase [Alphaproteobacteria bacterium]
MAYMLPDLPYGRGDLAPHVSERTLEFHHGKHHQAYVNKANELLAGKSEASLPLEDAIAYAREQGKGGLYNQVGQIWNHTFFWSSMRPGGGGQPGGDLGGAIDSAFGSYDGFTEKFLASAVGNFGSGWTFLVMDGGKLAIENYANAETPVRTGKKALLTIDVWEHAYYLDYQNRRPDFVKAFLDNLVNWDFATQNHATH